MTPDAMGAKFLRRPLEQWKAMFEYTLVCLGLCRDILLKRSMSRLKLDLNTLIDVHYLRNAYARRLFNPRQYLQ